jgi:hypothetical protein
MGELSLRVESRLLLLLLLMDMLQGFKTKEWLMWLLLILVFL